MIMPLILSLLPWKVGSEFVSEVADPVRTFRRNIYHQNWILILLSKELFPTNPFSLLHDYQEELKKTNKFLN